MFTEPLFNLNIGVFNLDIFFGLITLKINSPTSINISNTTITITAIVPSDILLLVSTEVSTEVSSPNSSIVSTEVSSSIVFSIVFAFSSLVETLLFFKLGYITFLLTSLGLV